MAKFQWHNKKNGIKNAVIAVLALATVCMGTALIVNGVSEPTKTLKTGDFHIATIEADGDYDGSGTTSLVSGYINADDLAIELEENAVVSFKVYYFDKEKEFISVTESYTVETDGYNADEVTPENAKYARVEITPLEDNFISAFEKSEYAAQVTVTVEK